MTMWNYNLQPTSSVGVNSAAPQIAAVSAEPLARYSTEQIAQLQSLIRQESNRSAAEQALLQIDAAGLRNNNVPDSFAAFDIINTALGNPVQPHEAAPIGNDAMTASVTTIGVANALGEQRLLEQSGRDSTTPRDVELMKSRIENRVKEMMASGASREEIERVARHYGSTPALADIAAEIATQQYDANRNPLADMAPQLVPATTDTARPLEQGMQNLLVGMVVGQNFAEEEARRASSYRPLSYPVGPIAAAIETGQALLGDLLPTQGLPNLKGGPSRGGPDLV